MVALCSPRQPTKGLPWLEGTRKWLRRQHRAAQPGLVGETKCMIPSVGKSDRAAREDIVLAHVALDPITHGTRHVSRMPEREGLA